MHHLSEEEAYLHLRNASRKSRRRILDVAGEVLGEPGRCR
jgi:AmiR/NasT family two-component response regulator